MTLTLRKFKLIAIAVLVFAFCTAFVDHQTTTDDPSIEGYWVYKSYKKGVYTYVRKNDFKSSKPGFMFGKEGKMTKRLDPDWCVRVKGPYTNLDGTYELLDAKTLKTEYKCPVAKDPSINEYTIVELTKKKLLLKSLPRKK